MTLLIALWNNKLTRTLIPWLVGALVAVIALRLYVSSKERAVRDSIVQIGREAYIRTKERMLNATPGDLDLSDREWLRKRGGS